MNNEKPAELIAKSGKTLLQIAVDGGVSLMTVNKAKKTNLWPAHSRTRKGLRRALGLDQPATVTHQPENLMSPELPARRG